MSKVKGLFAPSGYWLTYFGACAMGLVLGWILAPSENHNRDGADTGTNSVIPDDALANAPPCQAQALIQIRTPLPPNSASKQPEGDGLNLAVAKHGIKAALQMLPSPALDYAMRQFLPPEAIASLKGSDASAYLVGLFEIARSDNNTNRGNGVVNAVYVNAAAPTDVVKNGRIPLTSVEGSTAPPFQLFKGQPLRTQEPEDVAPAVLDSTTRRIYASFNSTSDDKYVIAKWTGPGGNLIDFTTYPVNDQQGVNYVWLERNGWQTGNYRVEYFSAVTLKPLATGTFVIK